MNLFQNISNNLTNSNELLINNIKNSLEQLQELNYLNLDNKKFINSVDYIIEICNKKLKEEN